MKRQAFFLALLITLGIGTAFAQGAIAGEEVCGKTTPCTFDDLGKIIKKTFLVLLQLAIAFVTIMIVITAIKVMTAQDKAVALREAKERASNVFWGLLVLTLVATGGYVAVLSFLKVDTSFLEGIRKIFSGVYDILPFAHSYAAETLPNPIPGVNNFLDFVALIIKLVVRFFILPIIIFAWAYTGFQYVYAQGNPQKLVEAHKWLLYTFGGTVIIMLAEVFAAALKGSFIQIFS